jgi:hypothetical protein
MGAELDGFQIAPPSGEAPPLDPAASVPEDVPPELTPLSFALVPELLGEPPPLLAPAPLLDAWFVPLLDVSLLPLDPPFVGEPESGDELEPQASPAVRTAIPESAVSRASRSMAAGYAARVAATEGRPRGRSWDRGVGNSLGVRSILA